MYFPYLKLRREESQAIKKSICSYSDNKVIPILEPFTEKDLQLYQYSILINTINGLISSKNKFILIINNENDLNFIKSRCIDFDKYCIRGYYSFNRILISNQIPYDIAVIHRDINTVVMDSANIKFHVFLPTVLRFLSYISHYPKNKVVKIENGFIKHSPNNTYPPSDDFNSESVFTYTQDGYVGFGDYTILEEDYSVPTGGQADKVTHVIHLTRQKDSKQQLEVCHYLTTPATEPDNRTRSILTLEKAYSDRHRHLRTKGIELIEEKRSNSTSPGYYKRIGIVHHIELMHSLI